MLTVDICSFSYRVGIPDDASGNGGGFVFDCRSIHNPGRYEPYKQLCGLDQPVKDFLENEPSLHQFLDAARTLVCQSVDCYVARQFDHLMVSFGCTGGQHRSVYCAQHMSDFLRRQYPEIAVRLTHRELEKMKKK